MESKIGIGKGWLASSDLNREGNFPLKKGQLANLTSPTGETVLVFSHETGTWVGLTGQNLTGKGGKVSEKEGAGVNLHTPGSFVQVGNEGDISFLKVEHIR